MFLNIFSESAGQRESESASSYGRYECRRYRRPFLCRFGGNASGRIAVEESDHFVYRVDEESDDIADNRRPEQAVVVVDYVAFEPVEALADCTAYERGDEKVLI